jgi:hypothetical protein
VVSQRSGVWRPVSSVSCGSAGNCAAGRRHPDHNAPAISGILSGPGPVVWTGDKGHTGNGRLTPIRKPQFRDLLEWERKFSTEINKIRYLIGGPSPI